MRLFPQSSPSIVKLLLSTIIILFFGVTYSKPYCGIVFFQYASTIPVAFCAASCAALLTLFRVIPNSFKLIIVNVKMNPDTFPLVCLCIIEPDQLGRNEIIVASPLSGCLSQYMPPMPPSPIAGAAGSGFGMSATMLSVVSTIAATEAAFCSAERVTLVGSTMPFSAMSP